MSIHFVPVADEVYRLYPEHEGNLERVKNDPDHLFFKKFGESMPKGQWNHPGTKQGVYMIGPNAEYLEGKFAASADPEDIKARMRRALDRWEALRTERGYANAPVPKVKAVMPPDVTGKMILRVNLRDLPRGAGDRSGSRFTEADHRGNWLDFTKWAWNENWIGFDDPRPFVTTSPTVTPVPAATITRICREVLVDNVRGQAPEWEPSAIREATLTKRKLGSSKGITEIEYKGRVSMQEPGRAYEAELYGRGEWVESKGEFRKLDIVAIGDRSGASQHNQRERDRGPAPMGIALSLFRE